MTKLNKKKIHIAEWTPFDDQCEFKNLSKETYEIEYLMDLISSKEWFKYVLSNYSATDVLVCVAKATGINHKKLLFCNEIYEAIKEKLACEEVSQKIEDAMFCLTINGEPITSGRIRTKDNVVLKATERVLASVVLKQFDGLPEHAEALNLLRDVTVGAMELISSQYTDDLED